MKQSRDAPLQFPPIRKQDDLVRVENALVVSAAGFEDRTLALASRIAPSKCRLGIALYKDWATNNRLAEIEAAYSTAGIDQITRFDYDRFEPDEFATELEGWLTVAIES